MRDVFISYSREDRDWARRFAEAFEAEGLSVWWDATLRSGEAFDQVIETALRESAAVVVLWSPNSVRSRWVRAEATQADSTGVLASVSIAPCKRPIIFELTHTVDLSHWTGDRADPTWRGLLDDVKRLRDHPHGGTSANAQEERRGGQPASAEGQRRRHGERRQVTVLSCALSDAGAAATEMDPEDWRDVVVDFQRQAAAVVERFDGRMTTAQGDALIAFFGAEQTRENDAERAVRAGLAIIELTQSFRTKGTVALSARVGVDTGLLVVGGDGAPAFGAPVGQSAQLQAQAAHDTVLISPATAALAGGYLQLEPLGAGAFKVAGLRATRTRFDLARARGLTQLVGRTRELAELQEHFERAENGDGQVVGLVAEAGSGKSRLCFEFLEQCRARGVPVFEGRAVAHGRNMPYLPILEMFRSFFAIRPDDDDVEARRKIDDRFLALDTKLGKAAPLVFEFLGVPDPERPAPENDPDARQQQLFGLMRYIIRRAGESQMSVTLIEDLHWLDPASAQFLEHMIDARAGARSLLLLNYRPEYHAEWLRNSWCRQIQLAPLGHQAIAELLADLLGEDHSLASLGPAIEARTQGNPYFVEEVLQTLVETGHLQGVRGAYRLVTPVDRLKVPVTVTAVVAARIDRLAGHERRLLQMAAVIGKNFSEPVLAAVSDLSPGELGAALASLRRAEFIVEQSLFPVAEYAFKHPLTQEVALGTLLKDERREVHAAVAATIEQKGSGALDERAALLAHHWEEAGEALSAARCHRRAAEWVSRTDPGAASWHWSRVRDLVSGLGEDPQAAELGVAACQQLLNLSWRYTVSPEEIKALGDQGRAFARAAGDRPAELKVTLVYARACGSQGDVATYVDLAAEAHRAALELDDVWLQVNAAVYLADSFVYAARLQDSIAVADDALARLKQEVPRAEWLMGFNPHSALKFWRATCLVFTGCLAEGLGEYEICHGLALEDETPEGACYVWSWSALAYLTAGDLERVAACSGEVDRLCTLLGDPPTLVAHRQLCQAYLHLGSGRAAEAIAPISAALATHRHSERQHAGMSAMFLAEAQLQTGDAAAAVATAEESIGFCHQSLRGNIEAQALGVLARALVERDGPKAMPQASEALERAAALIESTGARTLAPLLAVWRAQLAAAAGDQAAQADCLQQAIALFEEIGAPLQAAGLRQMLGIPQPV